ncbi:hypothetical protein RMSM_05632 [Rhodopirellula maiorica SM1]|uniref:Uncharacterized protein n=1 Tax=Rhodopirellula maiorica SM1 TaxID=1265738 RepID=M5RTZ5_9BACT|nr:hypothetical protein RMSM_05632 [Rhodopirellula maiorica SM1]
MRNEALWHVESTIVAQRKSDKHPSAQSQQGNRQSSSEDQMDLNVQSIVTIQSSVNSSVG